MTPPASFRCRTSVTVLSLAIFSTTVGCSDTSPYDPKPILESLGRVVMLPTYRDVVSRAEALRDVTAALCMAPDGAKLDTAQAAWHAVRTPWKNAEAFSFGPYREAPWRIGPKLDFWPMREDNVREMLEGTAPIDQAALDGVGTANKGLPVVEYFLFDRDGGDPAVLAGLGDGTTRRCDYLRATTADAVLRAQDLLRAWSPEGDDYVGELTEAGGSGAIYPSIQVVFAEVVNRLIFSAENIREMKIGVPAGKRSGGSPQPEKSESRFSDASVDDAVAGLDGVENVYKGDYGGVDGVGIRDFVIAVRPSLDAQVIESIGRSRAALRAIDIPLRRAVVEQPATVEAAYVALRDLHRILSLEVAAAIGVTVTFNDSDGD